MSRLRTRHLAAVLLAGVLPASAGAQTGEEIMQRAVEAYEERVAGIDEYTVTQKVDVMGQAPVTNRFVKRTREGHPVFVPASGSQGDDTPRGWGNPYEVFLSMAGRAELQGRGTVGGHEVWTLAVEDFSGVDVGRMTPAGARGEFEPASTTFQVDVESHVIRRLSMQGEMVTGDGENPIRMTVRFRDYRDRQGMLYPFRTEISVDGMDAVMSPRDRERAERQLERIRARLDTMSEARREKIEDRIRPQIEQLEKAVEEGRVEVAVVVQELVVNQGDTSGPASGGG